LRELEKKKCSTSLFLSLFPRLKRERDRERERVKEERLEEEERALSLSPYISLFYLFFKALAEPCFTLKF